jgi:hypothetical protein
VTSTTSRALREATAARRVVPDVEGPIGGSVIEQSRKR